MNDLLEYSYRAGVMPKEQRDHVKSMYQSYVPLHLMSGWDLRSRSTPPGRNVKAKHLLDNMGLLRRASSSSRRSRPAWYNAAYLVRATMMAASSRPAWPKDRTAKLSESAGTPRKITGREWLATRRRPTATRPVSPAASCWTRAGVPTGDAAAEVLIDNPQGNPIGDHYGPFGGSTRSSRRSA
ncbi:MAG: hypothetical protein IPO08_19955 [Xanthomonadales bacterium]|nr:hypothetical protein [Xanthomonadales bacterium]